MKKVLAILLAFALLIIPFGTITYAETSDYTDTTLTIRVWDTQVVGDNWHIYFDANGYTGDDWNYKYQGINYEIDGVKGSTAEISSAGGSAIFCSIPTSVLSANGTVITFKAGQYAATSGTSTGLNITQDVTLVSTEGRLTATQYIDAEQLETFSGNANEFYFSLKDINGNGIATGLEHWDCFLTPSGCDGTRMDIENWSSVYSGVFVDGQPLNYWDGQCFKNVDAGAFYIGGLQAVAGTKVTVKGLFVSSTQADWTLRGTFYLPEMTFTFDGSVWNYERTATGYKNVFLTGVVSGATSTTGDNMVLYLDTSNYTSINWNYKYAGFTIECNGVQGTTTQVSSVEGNRLYCTIPTSVVPNVDGTIFTIKAGQYAPDDAGTIKGINVVEDFQVIVSDGKLLHTDIIDADAVEIASASTASALYFTLKDKNGDTILTGYENADWANFLSPANIDGNRADGNVWSSIYCGVLVNGVPIDYFGGNFKTIDLDIAKFYVGGFNAVNGTTITIRGYFAVSNGNWDVIGNLYLSELNFEYDGSAWNVVQNIDYIDYVGTPELKEFDGNTGMYIKAGETEFPYDSANWSVAAVPADDESGVYLNGDRTEVVLKKVAEDSWYVCLGDAGIALEDGDEVIIYGSFVYKEHRITFEETAFYYEEKVIPSHTGTPVLTEDAKYGDASGFYFSANDNAPYAQNWSLSATAVAGDDNGVFVNDVKTNIALKKIDANKWFVCIGDAGVTVNYSDVIKIKGSFEIGGEIVTFSEATFQYDGKHFTEGVITPTEFTVTGLAYNSIFYDANSSRWHMYFNISNNIPGVNDGTYYPYFTYEIDGEEYTAHAYKSNESHIVGEEVIYNLYMPITQLPQTLDKEYVITLKAATIQGRNTDGAARADGIKLTEDYEFTVGSNYDAAMPTIDYLTGNGGNANGIYLSSNDAFPTTGWDYALTKSGEGSGVYVNGEATDVFLKKYEDNKYYVCLSDVGVTATEGTVVMIKGAFTTKNLNFVNFKTAKYVYTDGSWTVYSPTVETVTSTGVAGDANGDNSFDVLDFICTYKYVANDLDKINLTDADLNGDGKVNTADIVLTKKLILNIIDFAYGANATGVPTYSASGEMRLAAYVSPTVEGFDDYKAAGFTTLISENIADYNTAGFADYMNAASEKGLDVLVQAGSLVSMLKGYSTVDSAWLQNMYKDVSSYDSFRGLFMGDEPRISQLSNYQNVVNVLRTLDPHMDLFVSCLPTYTEEEYLSNDSSLSSVEKYSNYANSFGNLLGEFTYDFYPFKHSYKTFLGSKYNEKDYMRSDWFQNLTVVASNAKGKYDTGITVQSYAEEINPKDHYRTVTEADISFQVYTALAYGMKSINYFTYGEHWDSSVGTTSSMIYNGQKTDVYYAVQSVNNEIKAFDNVMLDFNWQGTIGIKGTNKNNIMNYVENYTSKRISAYSASNDAIIGCLKDKSGYDGFMLVNATDPSANVTETISVTFNGADHAKVYVNGVESIVELNNGTYETTLTPGQGVFVIPYIA